MSGHALAKSIGRTAVAGHQRLAGVELPAEEGVDRPRQGEDLAAGLGRQEVVRDLVAQMHGEFGPEVHDHGLRPDGE